MAHTHTKRFANHHTPTDLSPTIPCVTASVRATGYDNLPDTYHLDFFPREVKRVGEGARLRVHAGAGYARVESVYDIKLGPMRFRTRDIVEFVGYSESFVHGFCYIQVPTLRAKVSRFPLLELIRSHRLLTDSIPERRVITTRPLTGSTYAEDGSEPRTSNVEVHVSRTRIDVWE
ncbi:hypothetical protein OH77DRAFT_628979 [Trametes cingulata]|nr:hypothetical protein OH77DRAFT_628979 [Trametes cingulata]